MPLKAKRADSLPFLCVEREDRKRLLFRTDPRLEYGLSLAFFILLLTVSYKSRYIGFSLAMD
jgi:hypothetical protein